jgi:hypothetical protein
LSAGTCTSPNASVSALVSAIADAVAWKKRGRAKELDSFCDEERAEEERKELGLDIEDVADAANDLL